MNLAPSPFKIVYRDSKKYLEYDPAEVADNEIAVNYEHRYGEETACKSRKTELYTLTVLKESTYARDLQSL